MESDQKQRQLLPPPNPPLSKLSELVSRAKLRNLFITKVQMVQAGKLDVPCLHCVGPLFKVDGTSVQSVWGHWWHVQALIFSEFIDYRS